MATVEITREEFEEIKKIVDTVSDLGLSSVTLEPFKVYDENGDSLGQITFDYDDVRFTVGELG